MASKILNILLNKGGHTTTWIFLNPNSKMRDPTRDGTTFQKEIEEEEIHEKFLKKMKKGSMSKDFSVAIFSCMKIIPKIHGQHLIKSRHWS
jgi:hypothetical protein